VLRHSGYTAIKDQEVCKQIEIELAEDHLVRWRFQFAWNAKAH